MKKETLQRAVSFFNEINEIANTKKTISAKEIKEVRKKYATNVNFMAAAVCQGIFKKTGRGCYTATREIIEPIHVRGIINKCHEMYPNKPYSPVKHIKNKEKKAVEKPLNIAVKKLRTASLFFGLIKFQY